MMSGPAGGMCRTEAIDGATLLFAGAWNAPLLELVRMSAADSGEKEDRVGECSGLVCAGTDITDAAE